MPEPTRLAFLSLFVPNLAEAAQTYEALLGVAPVAPAAAVPLPHPFAAKGPVAFRLGEVTLALYECDGTTTHPGDVGIGLEGDLERSTCTLKARGGQVFWGPASVGPLALAIGVTRDRHFFELMEPASVE